MKGTMPGQNEETDPIKAKLEKLAERVRRGWAKLHPVTKAQLAVVNRRLREKWQQEAKTRQAEKQTSKSKGKSKQAKPMQSQSQKRKSTEHDQGHSH